jgi:ABC-type dipeptide/oligopeptide/nickel transport system permease component
MVFYVIRRILWLIPTLLAMALVTFLVMHATPGSPLDPVAEGANPLSPEAQKNLAEAYGLDKPSTTSSGSSSSRRSRATSASPSCTRRGP